MAAPDELQPAQAEEPLASARVVDEAPETPAEGSELRSICRSLQPPPAASCDSFDDTKFDCESYAVVLRKDAAERATRCLARRSGRASICRPAAPQECLMAAIRGISPHKETRSRCQQLLRTCRATHRGRGDMSLSTCTRTLTAAKPALQPALLTCMAQGCGLGTCVWDLADR